ncbi:hypothetical protein GCM10007207_15440 [Asaia siamensis]|uniref:Uncharacterized protein n=1 Tax=Asaia siamensis TaxID=110479 RepID=A0ABQ1LZD0_9PROT|nr:hypothetical protein GCM10007207_15440 [Asaia siamensis]
MEVWRQHDTLYRALMLKETVLLQKLDSVMNEADTSRFAQRCPVYRDIPIGEQGNIETASGGYTYPVLIETMSFNVFVHFYLFTKPGSSRGNAR